MTGVQTCALPSWEKTGEAETGTAEEATSEAEAAVVEAPESVTDAPDETDEPERLVEEDLTSSEEAAMHVEGPADEVAADGEAAPSGSGT